MRSEGDFEQVFASLMQLRAGGLVIGSEALFTARSRQLAALALRHAVSTIYQHREFVAAGGLVSYGGLTSDAYRLTGVYTGRVLKGEKPADLPVQQATKSSCTSTSRRPTRLALRSRCPCPAAPTS
jgi:putative ABC transport system substrate-binding protein